MRLFILNIVSCTFYKITNSNKRHIIKKNTIYPQTQFWNNVPISHSLGYYPCKIYCHFTFWFLKVFNTEICKEIHGVFCVTKLVDHISFLARFYYVMKSQRSVAQLKVVSGLCQCRSAVLKNWTVYTVSLNATVEWRSESCRNGDIDGHVSSDTVSNVCGSHMTIISRTKLLIF